MSLSLFLLPFKVQKNRDFFASFLLFIKARLWCVLLPVDAKLYTPASIFFLVREASTRFLGHQALFGWSFGLFLYFLSSCSLVSLVRHLVSGSWWRNRLFYASRFLLVMVLSFFLFLELKPSPSKLGAEKTDVPVAYAMLNCYYYLTTMDFLFF